MTYFLNQPETPPQIPANNPEADLSTFWGGLSAATSKSALENDANFRAAREKFEVRESLTLQAIDLMGAETVWSNLVERGLAPDVPYDEPASRMLKENLYWRDAIAEMATEAAGEDPQSWANIDFSDEAIAAEVDRRLQAEHAEASQVLDMLPPGQRGLADLAGGMAGITFDIKNLPFLMMGGGTGSFLRVMGREAAINMAAETAFLPSQYKMAERLDIPDPNVPAQLAMAAGAGAAFGLGGVVAARTLRYLTGRNRIPVPTGGRTEAQTAALMDRAEDILDSTAPDPLGDIAEMVRRDGLGMDEATPRPQGEADFQARATEAIDGPDWAQQIEQSIFESDPRMRDWKYPLGETIRRQGGLRWRDADGNLTPIAQEMQARGVTPRTHPFMWKKDGRTDLDNLVASEMGGLENVLRVDQATGYMDQESLIDALATELTTGRKTPMNAEVADLMGQLDRGPAPEAEASGGARVFEDGFTIDPADYRARLGDNADSAMEADIDGWLSQRGYNDLLTAEERAALGADMKERGGMPDDFMDRMADDILDRMSARAEGQEAIYDAIPYEDPVSLRGDVGGGQGAVGQGGRSEIGPETAPRGQAGRGAGDATPIGEVSPAKRPAGYVDQLTSRGAEPFSDPFSPEAKAMHDAIEVDLRTADPEMRVDMGDGERSVTDVLDDIDRAQDFADTIDLCGRAR